MGQVQSEEVNQTETRESSSSSSTNSQPAASMESLIAVMPKCLDRITNFVFDDFAEAAAYGDDENESLDAKAQKALECPCVASLRNGPCGVQFSEAFVCFIKSTAEEKGSDCVHPFLALQNCIKANPGAFSNDNLEEDEVKKEAEPSPPYEYRVIPPVWSSKPQSPKPKL